jgi:hypothetical protein
MSYARPTGNENTITMDAPSVMLSSREASAFLAEKKQILRLHLRMTFSDLNAL